MSAQDLANLEQARRNAAMAKARVSSTSIALKQRLTPASLAAEAGKTVRSKAGEASAKVSDAVGKRPVAASAVAGFAALILFRKPLGKLRRALFGKKKDPQGSHDGGADRDAITRAGEPPKPSVTPKIRRAVSQANTAAVNALNKE